MPAQRQTDRPAMAPLLRTLPDVVSFPFVSLSLSCAPFAGFVKDRRLLIEPNVFETPAVEDTADHRRQAPHPRLPAGRLAVVSDDRPGSVLLQFLVDLPHQLLAFFLVGLHRLLVEPLLELTVAVSGKIELRTARVSPIKLLIGLVDFACV